MMGDYVKDNPKVGEMIKKKGYKVGKATEVSPDNKHLCFGSNVYLSKERVKQAIHLVIQDHNGSSDRKEMFQIEEELLKELGLEGKE